PAARGEARGSMWCGAFLVPPEVYAGSLLLSRGPPNRAEAVAVEPLRLHSPSQGHYDRTVSPHARGPSRGLHPPRSSRPTDDELWSRSRDGRGDVREGGMQQGGRAAVVGHVEWVTF